jgi:predicted transcriptional regulator
LDICIKISNSSIKEIQNDTLAQNITTEEFEFLKKKIEEKVSKMVATTFEKSKTLKADIFGAFDIANKFHNKKTKANFETMEEFLEKLKLNVEVKVSRLEH